MIAASCASLLALLFTITSDAAGEVPPVFPGARGFGTRTVAGSGRHLAQPATRLFVISTLAEEGSGSLRECVEALEPRVCVFEVGGRITLRRTLTIRSPYLTIAGQSAPPPGISLVGAGLRVETHDVLIQHLEIRVGDGLEGPDPGSRDGLSIGSDKGEVYNVVADHLSVSWAIDENASTWFRSTRDVTFSNCLIAEGLEDSIHPKGPHSKGLMVGDGTKRVTLVRNLFANNFERNPRIKPGTSVEMINNVVYGWGSRGGWNIVNLSGDKRSSPPVLLSVIGNYFKPAPHSVTAPPLYAKPAAWRTRVFVSRNIGPGRERGEWGITSLDTAHRVTRSPFPPSGVEVLGTRRAYRHVLRNAGSRPAQRNPIDTRIIREIETGRGAIRDCILGCRRAVGPLPHPSPTYRKLTPPLSLSHDTDHDGYTDLEEWLFGLKDEVELSA